MSSVQQILSYEKKAKGTQNRIPEVINYFAHLQFSGTEVWNTLKDNWMILKNSF